MHAFLFSLALNAASESQAEALSGGLKVDAISGEAMCGAAVDAISGQATSGAAPPQCQGNMRRTAARVDHTPPPKQCAWCGTR